MQDYRWMDVSPVRQVLNDTPHHDSRCRGERFPVRNQQGQSSAIVVCGADRVAIGKLAGQGVEFKMGMETVLLQVGQQLCEARLQIGMFF